MTATHSKTWNVAEKLNWLAEVRSLRNLYIRLKHLDWTLKAIENHWRIFRCKGLWLCLQFRELPLVQCGGWIGEVKTGGKTISRQLVVSCIRPDKQWGGNSGKEKIYFKIVKKIYEVEWIRYSEFLEFRVEGEGGI